MYSFFLGKMGETLVSRGECTHGRAFVVSVYTPVFPPIVINIVVLDPLDTLVGIDVDPGDTVGQIGVGPGVKSGLFPSSDENAVDMHAGRYIVLPGEEGEVVDVRFEQTTAEMAGCIVP